MKFQGDWPWKADLKGRCTCMYGYWFNTDTGSCVEGNCLTIFFVGEMIGTKIYFIE